MTTTTPTQTGLPTGWTTPVTITYEKDANHGVVLYQQWHDPIGGMAYSLHVIWQPALRRYTWQLTSHGHYGHGKIHDRESWATVRGARNDAIARVLP